MYVFGILGMKNLKILKIWIIWNTKSLYVLNLDKLLNLYILVKEKLGLLHKPSIYYEFIE